MVGPMTSESDKAFAQPEIEPETQVLTPELYPLQKYWVLDLGLVGQF